MTRDYLFLSHAINFILLSLALTNSMISGEGSYGLNRHFFVLLFSNVFATFIYLVVTI